MTQPPLHLRLSSGFVKVLGLLHGKIGSTGSAAPAALPEEFASMEEKFWSVKGQNLMNQLHTDGQGVSQDESQRRLELFGPNTLKAKKQGGDLSLFLDQFKSPIIIILLCAALLSFGLKDPTDAWIILFIVGVSGVLGFWQERGARGAVDKLLESVETKAAVLRNGTPVEIGMDEVVPGDLVRLAAGDTIPGDCLILESKDLFTNEAALTGETYPVEKSPAVLPQDAPLAKRTNTLFMGTHVVSGQGLALVASTGRRTEFGKISDRLRLRPAETEFERGIRRFGFLLMEVTLVLVIAIFALNVLFHKPILDSLLFSLALAVGLTPQLLPAIISINLSHGAKRMAAQQVIVKRLSSIENFGCMNVLCSDKTGTITDGEVRLKGAFDLSGAESNDILLLAYLNAFFETGYASPIDEAIKKEAQFDVSTYEKLDEVPYDFLRKRLSVFVKHEGKGLVVAKGALKNIMEVCSHAKLADGRLVAASEAASEVNARLQEFSRQGLRVLGMCVKEMDPAEPLTRDKESDMTLVGLLAFWDPPKSGVKQTIANLKDLGVSLKIITGDNALIAETVAKDIGIDEPHILTGSDLAKLSDEALPQKAQQAHIFAEVEPNQKERIILAVKKAGNVVGYMGDGINDASALRAADVSISVDQAVDVAKEAADIVLLEKDLAVLEHGVREGRKTFANTLKYVFMATSANFGNMFSMAGASLFLSFLPLLPKQILLTNLLTDMPEMSIATDNVDEDAVDKPRRWDIRFIRNFMIVFGLLSSVFDYLTFGVLLWVLNATPAQFRTGWFLESIVSATMIVLVIRTRRPCISSRPGKGLFWATIAVILITHWLPYSPVAGVMGFEALPMSFLAAMWIIVGLYVVSAEIAKSLFYKKVNF